MVAIPPRGSTAHSPPQLIGSAVWSRSGENDPDPAYFMVFDLGQVVKCELLCLPKGRSLCLWMVPKCSPQRL